MPATNALADHHLHEARLRRLGRLAAAPEPDAGRPSHLALVRNHTARPAEGFEVPASACSRRVDEAGRIRLGRDAVLRELLGWEPGALEARVDGGWLVLHQPEALIGTTRQRNSSLAAYSQAGGGTERISLAPAHLAWLVPGGCREVLTVPVLGDRALLVANFAVCLAGAPPSIRQLLDPHQPRKEDPDA